jgi:hypothetical protein
MNTIKEKIEDLIWEFEDGNMNPYQLVEELKKIKEYLETKKLNQNKDD